MIHTASTSTERHVPPEMTHTLSHTPVQASLSEGSLNRTNLAATYHGNCFVSLFLILSLPPSSDTGNGVKLIELISPRSVLCPAEGFTLLLLFQVLYYLLLAGLIKSAPLFSRFNGTQYAHMES